MGVRHVVLLGGLLAIGCGGPKATPFDGRVTFAVNAGQSSPDGPVLSQRAITFLSVTKAGRTPIRDGWQEDVAANEQYGRHIFPRGTSAAAMAAYYGGLLSNAGWKEGADFVYDNASATLRFTGVQALDAGDDSDEVGVSVDRTPTPGGA
jgi:hypothetical protein